MALTRWEPLSEIDRFFDDLPARWSGRVGGDLAVDVYEKDNSMIAEMNLPGIDPERVNVSVEDKQLRISGSREESKEEKQKHYYSKEIRRGSFERIVRLPSSVKHEGTIAEFDNGMLRIIMPKAEDANKHSVKIDIKKK